MCQKWVQRGIWHKTSAAHSIQVCIVRQFRCCANIRKCTYTNLGDIAYYTPKLYAGLSKLSASLGHTGRSVGLGHTLNTL